MVKKLKNPAVGFGVTLSLLGLYGVFYLPLLVLWISKVRPYIDAKVELLSTFVALSPYMVKPLVQCVLLFLGPAVLMGIGFPIALQAWANHIHKVGRSTGTAYGANTIGAVIGGVLTGFILIPLLGLQLAISTLGLAGLWIAGIMCLLFARSSKASLPHEDEPAPAGARGRFILLVAAVILTVVVVKTPSNLFEIVVETNPRLPKQLKLLTVKEGVTATASVYRDLEEDTLWLYVSGQKVAGDTYFWRSDQKLLGHFGVLLNSQAKKVLSVGFGSGESTACLAMHKLERADCVEIAPEVVDVSLKFFTHINLGDKLNDYINMFYMDAKNYIHLTNIHYDAIVNDSIHPRHFAENASLYAKEFFETAREHLNDKGLLISWIPTHNVEPTSVLNSIIGTMMEVFPYVTIWYMTPSPAQYFLVVGSEQPQYFSPAHIENELNKKGVRESLSLIDINNNMDVMSCYIGDQDDIRRHIKSFSVNSDYLPFIEFTTDDQVGGPLMFKKFISEVRSTSVYKHIDWTGFSKEQKDKWLLDFDRLYAASSYLLASNGAGDYLERLKYSVEGLAILPDNPGLLHLRKRTEKDILSICMKKILSGETEDALLTSNDVINIYPESSVAWIIRSNVMQETGDMQRAYDAARMAVYHDPNSADAHFRLGSVLLINKQFEEAIKEYKDALRLVELAREFASYNQAQVLNSLTTAYAAAGRLPEAIAAAEKAFDFALSTGRKEMAEDIRKRLLSFESARTP